MSAAKKRSVSERASEREPIQDDQAGLFDVVLENELLESALQRRQDAADKLAGPKKRFKEADDAVKGMVGGLGLDDAAEVIRVGRFKLKRSRTAAGHREFDVGETERLSISLIPEG